MDAMTLNYIKLWIFNHQFIILMAIYCLFRMGGILMQTNRFFSVFIAFLLIGISYLGAINPDERNPMVELSTRTIVIDKDYIERLPVARDLGSILQAVPGVTTYQDQVSINGVSPYDNVFFIDGMDVTNGMQPNQFMNIPIESIEEVQISQGAADAQFGSGKGAVINVITKSGGNELHGSVYGYISPDFLTGHLDDVFDSDPMHYRSKFDGGFTLGGPIIKDKLWFFANYNYHKYSTQSQSEYDPPKDYINHYPFVKFTYQYNENNRFDLSYNYNRSGYKKSHMNDYEDWTSKSWTPRHGFRGNWRSSFAGGWEANFGASLAKSGYRYDYSSAYSNQTGRSQYLSSKEKSATRFRTRMDVSMPPFDCLCGEHDVEGGIEYGSDCYTLDRNSWSGMTYTNPNPDYPYSDIWESKTFFTEWARSNRFSVYLGDHFTFSDKLQLYFGTRYDFASYYWPSRSVDGREFDKLEGTSWHHISPRVSLTYDLTGDGKNIFRASAARYMQDPQYNWYSFANPVWEWGGEFNADMVPDTDPQFGEWSDDPADWLWWGLDPYDPYAGVNPNRFDPDFNSPVLTELTLAFEKALSDDISVALNYFYKKENRLVGTADGSRLDMDKLLDDGELSWIDYQEVDVTNPLDGSQLRVYQDQDPTRQPRHYLVNSPDTDRLYHSLQLIFSKKLSNGWMLDASFTYSDWKARHDPWDFDQNYGNFDFFQDPNAHINIDGPAMYQSPWAVKVSGLYQLPYGINATGYFQCYGGHPYNLRSSYTTPPFDDVLQGGGHVNLQEKGSERLPTFWMLNLGLEKTFKVSDTTTATLFVDSYNITNNQVELKVNDYLGSSQGEIQRILNPGLFQFGVRVSF